MKLLLHFYKVKYIVIACSWQLFIMDLTNMLSHVITCVFKIEPISQQQISGSLRWWFKLLLNVDKVYNYSMYSLQLFIMDVTNILSRDILWKIKIGKKLRLISKIDKKFELKWCISYITLKKHSLAFWFVVCYFLQRYRKTMYFLVFILKQNLLKSIKMWCRPITI